MLTRRIIPCLDIINNRVTKGVKFKGNVDLGDPLDFAIRYYEDGADELVIYDIMASAERRKIDIKMVRDIARHLHIPLAVGGGIASIDDIRLVLDAGVEKVSVNSLALENPRIIEQGAAIFGRQCMVLGIDPIRHDDPDRFPSGYEITTHGCRYRTGWDAVKWVKHAESLGAGEIVVNSVDRDGTGEGFELEITQKIAKSVKIPVVASGGAGSPQNLVDLFQQTDASAAIIAGMIHSGGYTISQVKQCLCENAIAVRFRQGSDSPSSTDANDSTRDEISRSKV